MFLHQHPRGKAALGIARQHRHPRLTQYRSGIQIRRHLMHRAARLVIACRQSPGMGMQPGVFRQQGRVNVQHPAGIARHKSRRQDPHEPGMGNDIGGGFVQMPGQHRLEPGTVRAKRAVIDHGGRHAQSLRLDQPRRLGPIGKHQHRARRIIALHRPHQGLHVRATPRNQDGHPFHVSWPL